MSSRLSSHKSARTQVEALVKRNHERAAEARRAFLPLLHPAMLEDAPVQPNAPTNGLSLPTIKVCACDSWSPRLPIC